MDTGFQLTNYDGDNDANNANDDSDANDDKVDSDDNDENDDNVDSDDNDDNDVNDENDIVNKNFPSMGTGELVDAASLEWEAELRDLLLEKRLISFRSCFFS